jgi:hypothetical protein
LKRWRSDSLHYEENVGLQMYVISGVMEYVIWLFMTSICLHEGPLLAHPRLLVWGISERFLSTGGTFEVGSASESQWLQPMVVLTVH